MRSEALKTILDKLSRYGFIKGTRIGYYKKYMILKRGINNMLALQKRWEHGFLMRRDTKSERKMKNFRMDSDKRERAAAIRGRILKNPDEKYKYILTNRVDKKLKGILNPIRYKEKAELKKKVFRWDKVPGIDNDKLINFLKKIYPDIENPIIEKSNEYEKLKITYNNKLITVSIAENINKKKFLIIFTGYKDKFCRCIIRKIEKRKHYYIFSKNQPELLEWNPKRKYHTIRIAK